MKVTIKGIGSNGIDNVIRLESRIRKEIYADTSRVKQMKRNLECINRVYPRDFFFPDWVGKSNNLYTTPSLETLGEEYRKLSIILNERYRQQERTPSERIFHKELLMMMRKDVIPSLWIGSYCIDLFIPNIGSDIEVGGRRMRGLAIEVDGDVHDLRSKMIKDEKKDNHLLMLGIGVYHVNNWDFKKPTVEEFKKQINKVITLDSRERKRMWRRIYSFTLALHLESHKFFQIFKVKK